MKRKIGGEEVDFGKKPKKIKITSGHCPESSEDGIILVFAYEKREAIYIICGFFEQNEFNSVMECTRSNIAEGIRIHSGVSFQDRCNNLVGYTIGYTIGSKENKKIITI